METNLNNAMLKIEANGILSEKDLKVETDKDGREKISGHLTLKTSDTNFVRFGVNLFKITNQGEKSKLWDGMETVMYDFKSIAEVGEDEATRVKVTNGQIVPYTNKFGKETFMYRSNTFNRIHPSNPEYSKYGTSFTIEAFVKSVVPEMVNNDGIAEETGRVLIKGWCPVYNGIEPITLAVDEDLADDVTQKVKPNETRKFYGQAVNRIVTTKHEIQVKIGKPRIEYKTDIKNELLVESVLGAYPEETAYNPETIKQAINVRMEKMEEARSSVKAPTGTRPSAATKGRSLNFSM